MIDIEMQLWPQDGHSLWDINNQEYIVKINWSKIPFDDYKKMANDYAQCGYLLFKEIIESNHDNKKSDTWFLTGIFLMRQSIELGLKALICRVSNSNPEIQRTFEECCHDLSKLFSIYVTKNEDYLSNEEKEWLKSYFASIEKVDEKSDMFRFPFEREFLIKYKNKNLDNVAITNNMWQAFNLISKCINLGTYDSDYQFKCDWEPIFMILASHSIGNCYLWESDSDHGFYPKITGYIEAANFIFYDCDNITLEQKLYPLIFLLRNSIELCLKRLFYANVDNGVPKNIIFSKQKSHLLKRDLWKNIQPMLQYYADSDADKKDINIVNTKIIELDALDKKGDCFRYPRLCNLFSVNSSQKYPMLFNNRMTY